jgi:hypothetical protein
MKWHVTIETVDDVYEFNITVETLGEAFIPLMRKIDSLGISQDDVVEITMERQND